MGLVEETGQELRGRRRRLPRRRVSRTVLHDLHREWAFQVLVPDLVDDAHAAARDLSLDEVATPASGQRRRNRPRVSLGIDRGLIRRGVETLRGDLHSELLVDDRLEGLVLGKRARLLVKRVEEAQRLLEPRSLGAETVEIELLAFPPPAEELGVRRLGSRGPIRLAVRSARWGSCGRDHQIPTAALSLSIAPEKATRYRRGLRGRLERLARHREPREKPKRGPTPLKHPGGI